MSKKESVSLAVQIAQTRQYIATAEQTIARLLELQASSFSEERKKSITAKQLLLDEARTDLRLLLETQERRAKAAALRRQYAGIEVALRDLAFMIEASYGRYSQEDFARDPAAAKLLKALHQVTGIPNVSRFRIVPVAPKKEKRP